MTYIVVSENEIVKSEMERPDRNIYDENGNLFWTWEDYLLSLPRIAIQGKHNWKVWQEVEESEVRLQHQRRFYFNATDDWFDCDEKSYLCQPVDLRRLIAIPIQPTPEGEKVEERKNIALLINTYDKGMIEYFRRHNYRLMYELWNQFKSEILNNDNPQAQ